MNIFYLDKDPRLAAQYHVDKHVVKMPLETAQLLCSVYHVIGGHPKNIIPYKLTHKNHPCSIWARESLSNYLWLVELGLEICKEYTYRYGKQHKSEAVINWCKERKPKIVNISLTPIKQAMPDIFKNKDPVLAYRNYYLGAKTHLFSWKKRNKPYWVIDNLNL